MWQLDSTVHRFRRCLMLRCAFSYPRNHLYWKFFQSHVRYLAKRNNHKHKRYSNRDTQAPTAHATSNVQIIALHIRVFYIRYLVNNWCEASCWSRWCYIVWVSINAYVDYVPSNPCQQDLKFGSELFERDGDQAFKGNSECMHRI